MTILLVAWGQFIDHDITLTAETKDIRHGKIIIFIIVIFSMITTIANMLFELTVINGRTGKTPKCCDGGFGGNHPNCLPIEIPKEDHFYKLHQRRCMNFVRSQAGLRYNCRLGPREQFNEISAVLDAGTVYSNVPERLESLR